MIIGIVDQSITGIEQPLRPAEAAHIVHITLVPGASISFRQQTLAVAKAITANGFSFGYFLQVPLGSSPPQCFRFLLG